MSRFGMGGGGCGGERGGGAGAGRFVEPLAVIADLRFFGIKKFVDLIEVRLCVSVHFFAGERRARFGFAPGGGRHRREIPNQEKRGVPKGLKMLSLSN